MFLFLICRSDGGELGQPEVTGTLWAPLKAWNLSSVKYWYCTYFSDSELVSSHGKGVQQPVELSGDQRASSN